MSTMTHGIGWFEIGTDDPATIERFYHTVFGWTFADDEGEATVPYRLVSTPAADSIRGGVFGTGGKTPNYAVFCVVVQDVAATCVSAEAAGGKVLVPPQQGGDGLVFAHLLDPSGNHFGIYSPPTGQAS
jgi:predicted enzyme related to lactoylglutathione lyase